MAGISALDVASYLLKRDPGLTTLELQKLTYYSQAWSMAWDGIGMFSDRVEAWQNGPVVPRLFNETRKRRHVARIHGGDADRLSSDDRAKIDAVLDYYGQFAAHELVQMTHDEAPWSDAWGDRAADDWATDEISAEAMRRFYTVQQLMGASGPRKPASAVSEAPLDAALEEADRQMAKWRSTLDWLAVR